jgi:hypothetical protein
MWEEKIDHLKKQFNSTEFKVPFTDWFEILKKIESKFIVKQDSNYEFTNWAENIKNKIFIQSVNLESLPNQIDRINENQNHWVVVVMNNGPTGKQYVYDCRPKAIAGLTSIAPGDFFIIDKKFGWLTYFERDDTSSRFSIYKSGEGRTPFDN